MSIRDIIALEMEKSGGEAKLVTVFSLVTLVCCVLAYFGAAGRY